MAADPDLNAAARPLRLLCVDDDRINALLLEQLCLQAGGIEIEVAASGAEALDVAARWRPDLLVVDLHLPDTDGYALLPRLRQTLGDETLPAVLCTAEFLPDVEAPARAAGFQQCWCKPVGLAEVSACLRRFAADRA
jgi:CheY-like chemotaxis protein